MNFPKEFYYSETKSRETFTDQPTGVLDVSRLIRGEAPWIVQERCEKKPKKLILADWTARNWSDKKTAHVRAALARLIDEGFTIYMEQSGQIKPLLKENLSLLDSDLIRSALKPEYPDKIAYTAVTQQHLTRTEHGKRI